MHLIFRKEEADRVEAQMNMPEPETSGRSGRPLCTLLYDRGARVRHWARPEVKSLLMQVYAASGGLPARRRLCWARYWCSGSLQSYAVVIVGALTAAIGIIFHSPLVAFAVGAVGLSVVAIRTKGEAGEWFSQTWTSPSRFCASSGRRAGLRIAVDVRQRRSDSLEWISRSVGGNSLWANFFASIVGALCTSPP